MFAALYGFCSYRNPESRMPYVSSCWCLLVWNRHQLPAAESQLPGSSLGLRSPQVVHAGAKTLPV